MTTDDRTLESALAGLRVAAPASLAPNVLAEVGLADRYARFDSPIGPLVVAWNGLGVSAVEAAADDATFEANHLARTGRPAHPVERRARPARDGDRAAARAATGGSASTSTCAATPTSSATSGTRRSRSRAARSGRTAGSPPRSAGRRRSGRSARPSGTTRCRSSCRAIGSSARTARSASTRSAGRSNKRTILEAEGLDLPEMERLAASGVRFIGSDTTKIFCLPTCRHARRVTDRHRLEFRSMADGTARGYRACLVCRPASAAIAA